MNIFSLINAMRNDLKNKSVSIDAAFSFLDDLEKCACEMSDEIIGLKASYQQSGNCFVNLNKDSKHTAIFCRQYHLHGEHVGNVHYMVECFADKNYGSVSNIVDGIDDFISSRFIEEKTPSKDTYGCMRINTIDGRIVIKSDSIVAISEIKRKHDVTAVIHLNSGKEFDTGLSYEKVASVYLDYLGKERGTIKRPVGI
ncbi:hypothetical protein H4F33_14570 [Pectobacterium brasiliense]|uniref:hypothetical protein n=1 Tax=Pectobacterium brasiliense TaxID=180957 RepID=UPI0015DD526D|nr:hypothetical protein [Pectobacterium brasiliense]MBA0216784.1 hypothetical protein [Pectobacterium brasiliense]MBN3073304.1 hypothetical protein [Pectobacterium brasiliense]MBN3169164.1 hypothetical protein [Pectobacterium brasiliense]